MSIQRYFFSITILPVTLFSTTLSTPSCFSSLDKSTIMVKRKRPPATRKPPPRKQPSPGNTKPPEGKDPPAGNGNSSGKSTVFRVHRYDASSEKARKFRIIEIKDAENIGNKTLKEIRKTLAAQKAFSGLMGWVSSDSFCDADGSEVSEDMALSTYVAHVKTSSSEDKEPSSSADSDMKNVDVYFRRRRIRSELDNGTKDFLKEKRDLTVKEPKPHLKGDQSQLTPSFNARDHAAAAGVLSHPADLSEEEWSVIFRTNCILSGHHLVEYERFVLDGKDSTKPQTPAPKKDNPPAITGNEDHNNYKHGSMKKALKVERSPYSAFRLKAREFLPHEISAPEPRIQQLQESPPPQAGEDKDQEAPKSKYFIPHFRVDDDSSVTVFETKTSVQHSMAENSFSETSVEASAGGGFWGVSAGVSAGFAQNESGQSVDASATEGHQLNVSYNFPRVTVYLDANDLEITKECEEDIKKLDDLESFHQFSKKYGTVFAQRVQLGGRLHSSEYSDAVSGNNIKEKSKAMKVSAAASISSSVAQASLSVNHGSGGSTSGNDANKDLNNSMAWEAKGGDTLLCNNPSAWCGTVGNFHNWRVINNCDVVPIYEVFSKFKRYKDVAKKFEAAIKATKPIRFKLIEQTTGKPLAITDDSLLCVSIVGEWLKGINEKNTPSHDNGIEALADELRTMCRTWPSPTGVQVYKDYQSNLKPPFPNYSIWEARLPRGVNTLYHRHEENNDHDIYMQGTDPSGNKKYLAPVPSLMRQDNPHFDYSPLFLHLQDEVHVQSEKAAIFLQSPGGTKKSGPIGPDDVVEMGMVDSSTGERIGLVTQITDDVTDILGIKPWKQANKYPTVKFKLEVIPDE